MDKCSYDPYGTRQRHYKSVSSAESRNWLFLPGGPGVDSGSLEALIDALNMPGDYWLIDLPLNGSNDQHQLSSDQVCPKWS